MIQFWKELFGNNINSYLWIFVLTSWIMISKLEINQDNLRIKISIIYILFYLLSLFEIFNPVILILILLIIIFVFIEFMYADIIQRKILKKITYYLGDYIYKVIFEYKILYFIFSLFVISKELKYFVKNIFLKLEIYNMININYHSIYALITIIGSSILLLTGVIKCINNEFQTYDFTEILNIMDSIMPFSKFSCNTKLHEFAKILIYREDRSFFIRKNTYNWISIEFACYRLRRMYNQYLKLAICRITIFNHIKFLFYLLCKFFKFIVQSIWYLLKILNKVFLCHKNIKKYIRGYSTIEMQLIRSIAVKDGYSAHIFQRKAYEFIYAKVFFSSLKNYYIYHHYANIDEFKYYLIYLYIRIAPVKINNKRYKNILELYEKQKINDITIEEFYIWVYGLSYYPITENIINDNLIKMYGINKNKLKTLVKKLERG